MTFKNPTVAHTPDHWHKAPVSSATFDDPDHTDDPIQLFSAASRNGTTNFEVSYEVYCDDGDDADEGTMTLSGSVPDVITRSNKFNCDLTAGFNDAYDCHDRNTDGYHVSGHAQIYDADVSDCNKHPNQCEH